ncbi:hypothetical protein HDZ31DRAFT_1593, partial [Schizophyllum fasciatum]
LKTKDGTNQLLRTAKDCDKQRGVVVARPLSSISYSYIAHRTLIALRCVMNHRPFESVRDPFYAQEIEMLRPGTKLPSPKTVSRDVKRLYEGLAVHFQSYLKVHPACL